MCKLGQHGLIMSDNALFNFGVLGGRAVIIDCGSRPICKQVVKENLTRPIRSFWYKMATHANKLTSEAKEAYWTFVHWWRYHIWADAGMRLADCIAELEKLCAKAQHM